MDRGFSVVGPATPAASVRAATTPVHRVAIASPCGGRCGKSAAQGEDRRIHWKTATCGSFGGWLEKAPAFWGAGARKRDRGAAIGRRNRAITIAQKSRLTAKT